MKRGYITILVALMTVALLGIILAQVLWMRTAIDLRNSQVNRAVNESLHNVAFRIDNERKWNLMHNQRFSVVFGDDSVNNGSSFFPNIPSTQSLLSTSPTSKSGRFEINIEHRTPNKIVRVHRDNDTTIRYEEKIYHKKKDKRNRIDFSIDPSIIEESQKAVLVQHQKRLHEMQHFLESMVTESMNPATMSRLNPKRVKRYLKSEFKNRRLNDDFEFAIFEGDTMLFTSNGQTNFQQSKHSVRLFPRDVIQRNVKLAVVFPIARAELLRGYSSLMLFSGLFTLFVLAVFTVSIYQIIKQKKLSSMKSDFINNMTHEFKTPLATIGLAADSIDNPKVIQNSDKINYFTGMIRQENKRLHTQIERILQVARLEKNDVQLKFETLSIHSIIEECTEKFKLRIEQAGGTFQQVLTAQNPHVEIDGQHIFNVMNNLIDNAIKYSPDAPKVKVKTYNNSAGIWVIVTDQGMGMNKKVQAKIFEQFYREQQGNVHNVKGHGLGLSYVKSIVTLHNGDIKVDSKVGMGSTFKVYLPYSQ